jgi:putative acetyltransferase
MWQGCSWDARHDKPLNRRPAIAIERDVMSGYSIVETREQHFVSLHATLDFVARELKYLAFTQAPPLDQSIAFYRSIIARNFPHFVAVKDETVVGWCDVAPHHGESRAHIGTLGIGLLPEARGQGLGRRLLTAAIDKAWTTGLTRLELTVREDNLRAKALYEQYGFEHEGVRRRGSLIDGHYHDMFAMALLRP